MLLSGDGRTGALTFWHTPAGHQNHKATQVSPIFILVSSFNPFKVFGGSFSQNDPFILKGLIWTNFYP